MQNGKIVKTNGFNLPALSFHPLSFIKRKGIKKARLLGKKKGFDGKFSPGKWQDLLQEKYEKQAKKEGFPRGIKKRNGANHSVL